MQLLPEGGFKNLGALTRRPEIKSFWFFLVFFAALIYINVVYLPYLLALIAGAVLVSLAALMFLIALKTVALNWQGNVEKSELKNIIFSLEDALIAYDTNFKVNFFNPAAERLFNIKASSILGHEIKPPDAERPGWQRLVQVVFPSLAPVVVNLTRTGAYPQVVEVSFEDPGLELQVTTTPVGDEFGNLTGFVKIIHDRTRETALMKSKGEFITIASHQIQSPVTNVNWALEELSKEPGLGESAKALLDNALQAGRILSSIVQDLLDVAKIEEGRFGYEFKETDLVEFVGKILAQILPEAQRAGVRLYFDQPKEQLPKVMIDPKKLTLVLTNLIDNATRYNIQNGEVVVKIEKQEDGPFLRVGIKDTGIGIPAADINKIFEKFFRATNALKFQTEGTGLGLYISKNIIQSHGGQVWAESELNRGSVFYFTLPTDPTLVPPKEVGGLV